MRRRSLTLIVFSFLLVALSACSSEKPKAAMPPATVQVITAAPGPVDVYGEAPAQTFARNKVDVRGRVDGYIEKWLFKPGDKVAAGQVLYVLDKRPYEAALKEARGNLRDAEANLMYAKQQVSFIGAKADLATAAAAELKAKTYYDRVKVLVKEGAVSHQDYDSSLADLQAAHGVVESRDAAARQAKLGTGTQIDSALAKVEANRGLVQRAELNVNYCTIKSPVAGLIGESLIPVGGLVSAASPTPLTTVVPLNPLWVRYKVTESQHIKNPASHGKDASLEMFLADGSRYPFTGHVANALNEVDRSTGTLEIQATFPNPYETLLPGQFGRVRFLQDHRDNALTIPLKAIQQKQNLSSIFVVSADNKVEARLVTLGPRIGENVVIERGLKAGDHVVVEGLLGIRPGATVNPVPIADNQQTAQGPTGVN